MDRLLSTVLALLLAAAVPVSAADDHDHDHSSKHDGIAVESGHHHLEIVARDGVLEVYVEGEDGKAENIARAKATAAVLSAGKKSDVKLVPEGDGILKGTGEFSAGSGTVIVITITMPDHAPEQVRVKLD